MLAELFPYFDPEQLESGLFATILNSPLVELGYKYLMSMAAYCQLVTQPHKREKRFITLFAGS